MWPWLNISSTSDLLFFNHEIDLKEGGKVKRSKIKYVFQAIVLRPGGTANARAVLNAQLDAWRKE